MNDSNVLIFTTTTVRSSSLFFSESSRFTNTVSPCLIVDGRTQCLHVGIIFHFHFCVASFALRLGSGWASLSSNNLVFTARPNSAVGKRTFVVWEVALTFLKNRYISCLQLLRSTFAVLITFFTVLTNRSTSPFALSHLGMSFRETEGLCKGLKYTAAEGQSVDRLYDV